MANTKISELTAITTNVSTDLILVSQTDGGGFASKKMAVGNLHYSITTPVVTPIVFATTITTDLTTGDIFTTTLTDNLLLSNPSGGVNGKAYTWWIKQGGAGSYSVTLGNKFILPSSASALSWSTAVGKLDMLAVRYDSGADLFYIVSFVPGY